MSAMIMEVIMLLVPGSNPGQGGAGDFSNGANIGINGSQAAEANWLLDGGTFTYPGSYNGTTAVPMEAISEVNVTASNMGAEYGNGMFSFSVITKSGTNQFHGSAFEFVQNNVFNARNYFSPDVPPERWNEYGRNHRWSDQEGQSVLLFQLSAEPHGGIQRHFLHLSDDANARRGTSPTRISPLFTIRPRRLSSPANTCGQAFAATLFLPSTWCRANIRFVLSDAADQRTV